MNLTQEQKREVDEFQQSLNEKQEWLFWNICSAGVDEVTYERKYKVMQNWNNIIKEDKE